MIAILALIVKVAFIAAGSIIVLAVFLLSIDNALVPDITDEEFLECLGTDWKTGRELTKALNEKYCPNREYFGTFGGTVYVRLHRLREEGLVEYRERALSEEELAKRDGTPLLEFRRRGSRRRIKELITQLLPVTA